MITTSDEKGMEEVEHLQDSPKENHKERNHARDNNADITIFLFVSIVFV